MRHFSAYIAHNGQRGQLSVTGTGRDRTGKLASCHVYSVNGRLRYEQIESNWIEALEICKRKPQAVIWRRLSIVLIAGQRKMPMRCIANSLTVTERSLRCVYVLLQSPLMRFTNATTTIIITGRTFSIIRSVCLRHGRRVWVGGAGNYLSNLPLRLRLSYCSVWRGSR